VVAADDRSLAIPRAALLELSVALQRRVIRRVMQQVAGGPHGPTFGSAEAVLEKIVRGRSGSSLSLRDTRAVREYQHVRFFPARHVSRHRGDRASARAVRVYAEIPSTVMWPPTGQAIRLRFSGAEENAAPAGRQAVRFDADRFTHHLEVRSWQAGDVFHPHGMAGRRKKLQDYFSDIKLPRERRADVPLLVAPEGILWVAGHRADHRFRVTPSTRRIVTAEITPAGADREGKG